MADRKDEWFFKRSGSDFDRRPGGPGESRQYARTYNVRSETEFTNRPETASQLREYAILNELEADRRRRRENVAQSRVHVFPSVGKFIVPEPRDHWANHIGMIKDKTQNLAFNPAKYPYFDKIIAEKLGNGHPAVDPEHPDYARYEGLRNNLAVMRNDIIGIYLKDGSFDPGDEKYIPYLVSIAETLAGALGNDTWYKRPFAPTVSLDVANVEGVGAREMYGYLLSQQTRPAGRLEEVRRRLSDALGFANRSWGLPPIEHTPYSIENLSAPLPPDRAPTPNASPPADENDHLLGVSMSAILAAGSAQSPETLAPPARAASVEEARTILRWLKNLKFGDRDVEEWLSHGTPPERLAKAEAVADLVETYAGMLYEKASRNPEMMRNLKLEDASHAAGAMAMSLASYALEVLPDGHPAIGQLAKLLDTMPREWDMRQTQSVAQLLETLETGFSHIAGDARIFHEKPAAERLLEMSDRIAAAAYELRSVDRMRPPAREESVELAREILRKLKHLQASDRPIEELAVQGTAEDKADFAQKIGEMVDIYHNLLAEAAQITPGIVSDARVREANDAVGSFAHTIKLMAAKEIPASIAAAQQISADVTQMPEEWKGLHSRTVGRLMSSMEGGLESAVNELAAEQQEKNQDEEVAQEAAEHLHGHHRRRRRRKQRSGFGAAKQRKEHLALTADDYVLKQGRFREDGGMAPLVDRPIMPGIRPEDLAAIRNLGNSLRDLGNQANTLAAPVMPDEKIAPDDRTLAMREQEQRSNPNKRHRDRDRL